MAYNWGIITQIFSNSKNPAGKFPENVSADKTILPSCINILDTAERKNCWCKGLMSQKGIFSGQFLVSAFAANNLGTVSQWYCFISGRYKRIRRCLENSSKSDFIPGKHILWKYSINSQFARKLFLLWNAVYLWLTWCCGDSSVLIKLHRREAIPVRVFCVFLRAQLCAPGNVGL